MTACHTQDWLIPTRSQVSRQSLTTEARCSRLSWVKFWKAEICNCRLCKKYVTEMDLLDDVSNVIVFNFMLTFMYHYCVAYSISNVAETREDSEFLLGK